MNNLDVPLQARIADLERELSEVRGRADKAEKDLKSMRGVLMTERLRSFAQGAPPPMPLPHRLFWRLMTARVVVWLALGCFGVILLLCAWGLLALLCLLGLKALQAVGL